MVEGAGIGAARLASLAVPWLQAMTAAIPFEAAVIDSRDYTTDTQSLAFTKSALDSIVAASRAQGVGTQVLDPILALVEEQIAAGHGDEIATRTIEGIRRPGVGPS
jgi:hypothetical protein